MVYVKCLYYGSVYICKVCMETVQGRLEESVIAKETQGNRNTKAISEARGSERMCPCDDAAKMQGRGAGEQLPMYM